MGSSFFLALFAVASAPSVPKLEIVEPNACADASAVRAATTRFREGGLTREDVRVELRFEPAGPSTWNVGVRVEFTQPRPARVEREVEAVTCEALPEVAGLLIAVALDGESKEPLPVPPKAPEAAQEDPRSPVAVVAASGPSWGTSLGYGGGVDVGGIGRANPVVQLLVGLQRRALRIDAGLSYVVPVGTRPYESQESVVVRLGLVAARGALCFAPELPASWALALCAGVEAGAVHGSATGLEESKAAFEPWLAGRLGGDLAWRARNARWGWQFRFDGAVKVLKPRFVVDGLGVAHQSALTAMGLWTGPVHYF